MRSHDDTLLTALALFLDREDLITILRTFGGQRRRLPTLRYFLRDERARAVIEGWRDGGSYESLARKHQISTRTVRRVIEKGRRNTP